MKLQKLVYYAQAWALVWDDEPIFDEEIEAWANGPVVRGLYEAHLVQKNLNSLELPISELLDTEALYLSPEDSVEECMSLMTSTHIRHLPVLNNGQLIGIISIGDMIKQAIADGAQKMSLMEGYIFGHYGAA
jgi:uncharacterized phage-associated protein